MPALELRPENDTPLLVKALYDAYEDEAELRNLIEKEDASAYLAWSGRRMVGAVTVLWAQPSEIELLAVVEKYRGKGYGRAIIEAVLHEAQVRGIRSMLVGTGNFAVGNMIFYQKCGFRMDHVRRDCFPPTHSPMTSRGILLRDMIVFKRELS